MAYSYYPNYAPYMQYQQPQAQQSSFIHVQNEMQAREWSLAPNTSMMFIDDNSAYIYTKTAPNSQLEPAVFKRFKIIEDNTAENVQNTQEQPSNTPQVNLSDYITKAEFEPFKTLLEKIEKELFTNEPTE